MTALAASVSNCCGVLPLTWAPMAAVATRRVSVRRTASLAMSSRAKGLVSAAPAAPRKAGSEERRASAEREAWATFKLTRRRLVVNIARSKRPFTKTDLRMVRRLGETMKRAPAGLVFALASAFFLRSPRRKRKRRPRLPPTTRRWRRRRRRSWALPEATPQGCPGGARLAWALRWRQRRRLRQAHARRDPCLSGEPQSARRWGAVRA